MEECNTINLMECWLQSRHDSELNILGYKIREAKKSGIMALLIKNSITDIENIGIWVS